MDFEKDLPLAPRDLLILSVLAEGPLHGYGIIKAVEQRSQSGVLLDPANLYRVLRRIRGIGWIREESHTGRETAESSAGEPKDYSSGTSFTGRKTDTRRKTYEITKAGRSLLAAELARLERLLEHARPALANGNGR